MKKTWVGKVKSKSSTNTIMVSVESYVKHLKYGKYMRREYLYCVHDEMDCLVGEKVRIGEVPPISKTKSKIVLDRMERVQ